MAWHGASLFSAWIIKTGTSAVRWEHSVSLWIGWISLSMSHPQQKHKQYLSSTNSQHADWFCEGSVAVKSLPEVQSHRQVQQLKPSNTMQTSCFFHFMWNLGRRDKTAHSALSLNLYRGNACAVKLVFLERLAEVILIHSAANKQENKCAGCRGECMCEAITDGFWNMPVLWHF